MNRPASAADPHELADFLQRHPGIGQADLYYTNLSGVPRGKRLRRHELAAAWDEGRFLPTSLLVVDVTGRDVEDTGLVWEGGDADLLAWPVAGTLAPAPWLGDDAADAMIGLHGLDGTPCDIDPRVVLGRVLERFAADGLTPVVACEMEFYLLDAVRDRDGAARNPRGADGGRATLPQVYGLEPDDIEGDYLRALWAACDAAGLPAGAAISEYAAGQLELTLHHKDALGACDDAVRFKRAAKGVAANRGRTATFMAKPFAERSGSGMHMHVSVLDRDGRNIFASEAPEGSPALGHAIAGALAILPEAMAVFAPNANSYRRFRANSYAPTRAAWGVNNRTVPLRVPAGPASSRRFECREAGADANPYLAMACVLAGVHHGLSARLDPGPATTGDGYAGSGVELPTDWVSAINALARSDRLRAYLGDRTVDMYACVKRIERERYEADIPVKDYDWLLRSA